MAEINLQGIISFYSLKTGDHHHDRLESFKYQDFVAAAIKDAKERLIEIAKNEGAFYKQIWIKDRDSDKILFYKQNFQ